jgi:diaminopimelate decarboxylase
MTTERLESILACSGFQYRDGVLHCGPVSLATLASEVGTPAYVYSAPAIERSFTQVDEALRFAPHLVAYAVKANSNLAVLRRLGELGAGADVVSGGELERARAAGIPPERIVFSGVGKTDDEMRLALTLGVRSIHVESVEEIDALEHVAAGLDTTASICFRLNPDVDPITHPYISTGLRTSKFGFDFDAARAALPRVQRSPHLTLKGLACHIGSQLKSIEPITDATAAIAAFARECASAGHAITTLDVGGGWAVDYGDPDDRTEVRPPRDYGLSIQQGLRRAGVGDDAYQLIVEPGRIVVANAGVLLTRVIFTKQQGDKRFVIVDAAMTELLRPALYRAYHGMVAVHETCQRQPGLKADVVGPVCETGDFLALGRDLPPVQRGDLIAVCTTGAYASVMGSHYNTRPKPPEVLVNHESYAIVRARESTSSLWRDERMV